jgi:hypothetical protein
MGRGGNQVWNYLEPQQGRCPADMDIVLSRRGLRLGARRLGL